MNATHFNPASTSGIGFKLEHYVQASYLASMLLGTPVLFDEDFIISELIFQGKHIAETDDLIVHLNKDNCVYKHYLQVKKGFEMNKNDTFDKVIDAAYKDFKETDFSIQHNRFIIFTDVLSKTDSDDGLTMLDWARFSKSENDFTKKLSLNKTKANKYKYFRDSLNTAAGTELPAAEIWEFLKCFYVKEFDYLSAGSKDLQILRWFIKPYTKVSINPEQALLKLIDFIVTANQHGGSLTIENIPEEIKDIFNIHQSDRIGPELKELFKKSRGLIDAVDNTIGDFHLSRHLYIDQIVEMINKTRFLVLTGDGGVGKTAIVKEYLTMSHENGSGFIALKADILDKSTLAQSLSELGVHQDMETLISQWLHLPRLIIFIDSFEKLYEGNYSEAFLELLTKVKNHPNITLIATCRSYAFETLRKKFKILPSEIANISIAPLTKEELKEVEKAKPQLQKLLQNAKLHKILSLPFFLEQAFRAGESITETDNISEVEFKNAVWEQGVEKKGTGSVGHSRRRGHVFSKIVLKRAVQKRPYITCEESDIEIAEELYNEGMFIKHPRSDSYAPKHDILEDIVVGKFLDNQFEQKESTEAFLASIDTSPVFRRGLRFWIQDLIQSRPVQAKTFLGESLELYNTNATIIDELLVGILGSEDCTLLLNTNQDLLLANNLKLFYKLFHLAKVAYVLPFTDDPKRKFKTIGFGWNALVDFLIEHYSKNTNGFDIVAVDLFKHWTLQFEVDDHLSAQGRSVATFCLSKLPTSIPRQSVLNIKELLEILFFVIPAAIDEMRIFFQNDVKVMEEKPTSTELPVDFYRKLNKMLLVETYKCVKVYKYFPDEVIALAKIEWYSEKLPEDISSDYQESSFGLTSYPYNYFSASAFQTPIRFLLHYHFDRTLNFIIELTNRALEFYKHSSYAQDLMEISIPLNDGSIAKQMGNESLFSAYRGISAVPDLVRSILMALETCLLEKADQGEDLSRVFISIIKSSNSVLLTGVLVSVSLAYPFVYGKEIYALLKIREFFKWDLRRVSADWLDPSISAMGNDPYYTNERMASNRLPHRRQDMEKIVFRLQLSWFADISFIIDKHLAALASEDQLWKLALFRLDARNTNAEIIEEEDTKKVAFIPKPLPADIKTMFEDNAKEHRHDTNATSIFLYGEKLFKGALGESPNIAEWRENYLKSQIIDFSKVSMLGSTIVGLAAGGIKYFTEDLLAEELQFCSSTIANQCQTEAAELMAGNDRRYSEVGTINAYHILPKLLATEFKDLLDQPKLKEILIQLLLLADREPRVALISGIKNWLWDIDHSFATYCFKLYIKYSTTESIFRQLNRIHPQKQERSKVTQQLIENILALPDLPIDQFSILDVDRLMLVQGMEMIPFNLLANNYYPFLRTVVVQLSLMRDLKDFEEHEFTIQLKVLIANFLLSSTNENTFKIIYILLVETSKTHFAYVVDIFNWVIFIGHDRNYPEILWEIMLQICEIVLSVNPKVGFFQILLLNPLIDIDHANKLPNKGMNLDLHKAICSDPEIATDVIVTSIFKLLAGVGSTYQPESLKWIMKSLPNYQICITNINGQSVPYFEKYAMQLFDHHLESLKINKEQLDYYIMLLSVLISFGSREAFRIRDMII